MEKNKAYKVLAEQLGISNKKAKDLIDKGVVYLQGKKVVIARADVDVYTEFKVMELEKPTIIFEDENILAINKPAFSNSSEIERMFKNKGAVLLHRLDKGTSGILLLVKNEEFRLKAIEEFKQQKVYKEYLAIVNGIVSDKEVIDKPILTEKKGNFVKSTISEEGKDALTEIEPLEIYGKKTKLKVIIKTGRTHQIRIHLSSIDRPVVGDEIYGGTLSTRLLLHAKKVKLFDYVFETKDPKGFQFNH